MTILINTKFTPFRLSLRKKEPVQLYVELVNKENQDKRLLYELLLGAGISLDRPGIKNKETKRFEPLKAGEKKFFYYQIFPKPNAYNGEIPVSISLIEPEDENYEFVKARYKKEFTLTIED
jgi:hypothetical protein